MDLAMIKMRMFPIDDPATGIGGAVVYAEGFYQPSESHGTLIYLNGNPDVQIILERVEAAGRKVVLPKQRSVLTMDTWASLLTPKATGSGLHSVPPM
ncbi:MAG: hypothetical protein IPP25_18480 [Saprospiraceae bacterium]|nr:hypothetical protein [Candidatus Opimibacter skivensis]